MAQAVKEGTREDGRVVRVIGPGVDVEFPPEELPEITFALELDRTLDEETDTIVCEVAQHVGDSTVRAIAMKPTHGVARGTPGVNTRRPMAVPGATKVAGPV